MALVGKEIESAAPSRSRFGITGWIAAGVLAVLFAALAFVHFRQEPVEHPLVRLDVDSGADVSLQALNAIGDGIAISPDGIRLAYTSGAPPNLFIRRLNQPKAMELTGTQGANFPFFARRTVGRILVRQTEQDLGRGWRRRSPGGRRQPARRRLGSGRQHFRGRGH